MMMRPSLFPPPFASFPGGRWPNDNEAVGGRKKRESLAVVGREEEEEAGFYGDGTILLAITQSKMTGGIVW